MVKSSSAQNCKSCIRNNEWNCFEILYTHSDNLCTDFSVQLHHNVFKNEVYAAKGHSARLSNEKIPF